MNTQKPPSGTKPAPGKAAQLKAAAQSVQKTGKVSKSTQPCASATPPKDWACVSYHKLKGPKYNNKKNQQPMKDYGRWHAMIDSGKITETDAKLMMIMSPNEGDFNSVQAFDNQAITAGAMQKTIDSSGKGELTTQLKDFKAANPDKYKSLFQDKGWDVEEVDVQKTQGKGKRKRTITVKETRAKYTYTDKDGKTVTIAGDELYAFIKSYCDPATSKEKKAEVEKALDSMRQGVEDDAFKDQQVIDFKKRIDEATSQKPVGYDHPISDYATSAKSRAAVLDQSVNRPAYVDDDYGKALDDFYKNNPKVSKDPATWGDQRSKYEDEINESYGLNRRGTDMADRYKRIKKAADPVIPPDITPK
ncbi:hypothetical protein [Fibrella arboris]|uniref:hypothetical protein n=1 Tax=Fibrella arboris TaxID=3242486 RepID=UPI00351FA3DF